MLAVIISNIIFFIISFFAVKKINGDESLFYKISLGLLCMLSINLVVGAVLLIGCTRETGTIEEIKNVDSKDLYSLDLTSENRGTFFLGSGSVSSDKEYYFYVNNNGRYELKKEASENVGIYLIGKEEKPRIEYVDIEVYNSYKLEASELCKKMGLGEFGIFSSKGKWVKNGKINNIKEVNIYIPEGSIKNNYDPNINK